MEQAVICEAMEAKAAAATGGRAAQLRQCVTDYKWAHKYLPAVIAIMGPARVATVQEDQQQATDLVLLDLGASSLAVRVQGSEKAFERPWDMTLRSWRAFCDWVELQKILDGWCRFYFYAHASRLGLWFRLWTLIDLNVFRAEVGAVPRRDIDLHDGTAMVAYDMRNFSPGLIIARGVSYAESVATVARPRVDPNRGLSSRCGGGSIGVSGQLHSIAAH